VCLLTTELGIRAFNESSKSIRDIAFLRECLDNMRGHKTTEQFESACVVFNGGQPAASRVPLTKKATPPALSTSGVAKVPVSTSGVAKVPKARGDEAPKSENSLYTTTHTFYFNTYLFFINTYTFVMRIHFLFYDIPLFSDIHVFTYHIHFLTYTYIFFLTHTKLFLC